MLMIPSHPSIILTSKNQIVGVISRNLYSEGLEMSIVIGLFFCFCFKETLTI